MAIDIFKTLDIIAVMENHLDRIRPPENIRMELDLGYQIENQSIILVEIRPKWNNPAEYAEYGYAKTTYVKRTQRWKIFWLRADLKWHVYDPVPEVDSLQDFLQLVNEDALGCFGG